MQNSPSQVIRSANLCKASLTTPLINRGKLSGNIIRIRTAEEGKNEVVIDLPVLLSAFKEYEVEREKKKE